MSLRALLLEPMATIHQAAAMGDIETLRRLLAEGVSPDAINGNSGIRRTPLHFLCLSVNGAEGDLVSCLKLLRDAGANLEATDSTSATALHHAANAGYATLVSSLVEAGVNVDARDFTSWTPLHLAARGSYGRPTDCVEVLLAAGADIDVRSQSGSTPFLIAHSVGHRRAWPLFLRAGAEVPQHPSDPYMRRVVAAGGFQRYAQNHLARIASILAPTPLLPPELVRKVLEFWLHAGYY